MSEYKPIAFLWWINSRKKLPYMPNLRNQRRTVLETTIGFPDRNDLDEKPTNAHKLASRAYRYWIASL